MKKSITTLLMAVAVLGAAAQADSLTKQIAPWMFVMQLADFTAPAGCTLDTVGVNGTNYDPSTTVLPIRLTDQNGNSDTAMVAPNASFVARMNSVDNVMVTQGTFNGKVVETVLPAQSNTMIFARVGNVTCGQAGPKQ